MSNSSAWLIDRTLSGATTLGQSEPGSNGHEGIFRIPQSFCIIGSSPSDCLVSYPGILLGVGGALPLCRDVVGVFYCPSRLGSINLSTHKIFICITDEIKKVLKLKLYLPRQKSAMNESLIFLKIVLLTFHQFIPEIILYLELYIIVEFFDIIIAI